MYSYLFEEFKIENTAVNFENPVLWIIHSDKTPPHIGISQNFKFFSLKATGKDYGISTSDTFDILKRKKIEFIALELKIGVENKDIELIFSIYTQAIPTKISCITPVLACFKIDKPLLLFDLIKYLNSKNLISEVNVFNFQRDKLTIGMYSEKEVTMEIEKLQSVTRN